MNDSQSFGGLKDFSVDAQRRMFIEQQERERQAAENKKASRKYKQAAAGATGVELSGMMASVEAGGPPARRVRVGDDDDDSIADDWSLDSEESFYVGIERADYAQPDNLEMYGEGKEEDDREAREDRFGISRVSIAIINRENAAGRGGGALDWDADVVPVQGEGGSSLREFMNGTAGGGGGSKSSRLRSENVVAAPIVGTSLEWNEDGKLGEEVDAAIDQVYQHKAAEGKAFIDKLVGAPSSSSAGTGSAASALGEMGSSPATPGLTPAREASAGGAGGNYPVLSPMMLFSPGLTTPDANKVVEGEDNGLRQMREREIRKDAHAEADRKLAKLKNIISSKKDREGKVDASALMKQLEKMLEEC